MDTDSGNGGTGGGGARPPGSAGGSAAPGPPGVPGVPGSAVASVVMGVAGVVSSFAVLPGLVCGVAAAALAHRAAAQTGVDAYPGGRPGRGLATTGKALAGVALVLSSLFGAWFFANAMGYFGRQTRGRPWQSTQLRGMHQGMFTYANSNKEHFPGLDSKGSIVPNSADDTGNSGDGDTIQARYWIMLEGNFFTPEYAISPSETDPRVIEYDPQGDPTRHPVLFDNNTRHYSFALLSIDGTPGLPPDAGGRAAEWNQVSNTQAVVAADRNTGPNATAGVQSIHTQKPGDWQGRVLWNDNHVAFEQTHILETRYGNGPLNVDPQNNYEGNDNLFEPAGDDDAYLIHEGD